MFSPRLALAVVLACQLIFGVYAMKCNIGGIILKCPILVNRPNEAFCCTSSLDSKTRMCCNFEAYVNDKIGFLSGLITALLIVISLMTVCCCYFCNCCCFAKLRRRRGTAHYGPITGANPSTIQAVAVHPLVPLPTNNRVYSYNPLQHQY